MAVYQAWIYPQQRTLVPNFAQPLQLWTREEQVQFGDHQIENIKECCYQLSKLVQCHQSKLELRRWQIFGAVVREYLCHDGSGVIPPTGIAQYPCGPLQSFESLLEEQGYTPGRLQVFYEDLCQACAALTSHRDLWACDPVLEKTTAAYENLFADARLMIVGLMQEKPDKWMSVAESC